MARLSAVRLAAALGAGIVTVGLAAAPASAASTAPASLTVVHGVRGLVADVRLDGKLVLSGFAPERVTDPLNVPAGRHHVQAWPTGAAKGTAPVVDQNIEVRPGEQATAAIGLDAAGKPRVTVYDDGALLKKAGSTALVIRGLAAASGVKVTAGDQTLAASLQSTQQSEQTVPPGTYAVTALSADGSAPLVPSQDVPVAAGRAVVLYLIGSQQQSTLGWVAQTVRPAAATAAPRRVDTGVGPLPTEERRGVPGAVPALSVGAGLVVLVRGRRRLRV